MPVVADAVQPTIRYRVLSTIAGWLGDISHANGYPFDVTADRVKLRRVIRLNLDLPGIGVVPVLDQPEEKQVGQYRCPMILEVEWIAQHDDLETAQLYAEAFSGSVQFRMALANQAHAGGGMESTTPELGLRALIPLPRYPDGVLEDNVIHWSELTAEAHVGAEELSSRIHGLTRYEVVYYRSIYSPFHA